MIRTFILSLLITLSAPGSLSAQADSTELQHEKTSEVIATEQEPWFEKKAMAWIVALVVAATSVFANILISHNTRKTTVAVATQQINNSINLAKVQFQSNLNSKNRQDWINEVRNCISEFATNCRQYNIAIMAKDQNQEKRSQLQGLVYLYRSKLTLLLNPDLPMHDSFLKAVDDLITVLEIHFLNERANIDQFNHQNFLEFSNNVLEKGRDLLYNEWHKIQKALTDT